MLKKEYGMIKEEARDGTLSCHFKGIRHRRTISCHPEDDEGGRRISFPDEMRFFDRKLPQNDLAASE